MQPAHIRRFAVPRGAGFTLLELIIAMVIVGVITALAMPRVDPSRARADTAAQSVRAALQHAQRTALLRQHDVSVAIDTTGSALWIVEDRNNNGRMDSGERRSRESLGGAMRFASPVRRVRGQDATASLSGGFTVVDDLPAIVMRRDGSASTDAEMYLVVRGAEQREWRAVTVARATGRSDWYRGSPSGTWKRSGS